MLCLCIAALVLCKAYLGSILFWVSQLSGWEGPVLLCLLFLIVSLPMMWGKLIKLAFGNRFLSLTIIGYIVLNFASGYLYGFWAGLLVTVLGATAGALLALVVSRVLWKDYVARKISSFSNVQQLLRVLEGPQGFRIVMMTRLTPLPFGLQNALLSVCQLQLSKYFIVIHHFCFSLLKRKDGTNFHQPLCVCLLPRPPAHSGE